MRCSWFGINIVVGPVSAAHADDEEDEHLEVSSNNQADDHRVVIMHRPHSISSGLHGGEATHSEGCEDHESWDDGNDELEEEGEETAVCGSDSLMRSPSTEHSKETYHENNDEAGHVQGSDDGQLRTIGLAVEVAVQKFDCIFNTALACKHIISKLHTCAWLHHEISGPVSCCSPWISGS